MCIWWLGIKYHGLLKTNHKLTGEQHKTVGRTTFLSRMGRHHTHNQRQIAHVVVTRASGYVNKKVDIVSMSKQSIWLSQ